MSVIVENLGETLVKREDDQTNEVKTESLIGKDKIIALLFSANWCPPCRTFTTNLIEWYTKLTAQGKVLEGKFEVVFISSDENETEFKDVFKTMPWYALPFADRDRKKTLTDQYKITGIPSLLFIDSQTGKITSREGRRIVMDDKEATGFPWIPTPVHPSEFVTSFLTETLIDKDGNTYNSEDTVKGKHVALYFSALWCPPCKRFTPRLIDLYNKINEKEKKWEIVYFSLDRNQEEYDSYFATLPFKGLPLDTKRTKKMARRFFINGIPALVMMNDKMEVLNLNARTHVELDANAELFPWKAGVCEQMNSPYHAAFAISHPSVIFAPHATEEGIAEAKSILKQLHESFQSRKSILLNFLYYTKGADTGEVDPCEEIFLKAVKTQGICILFDAKNSCKYIFEKLEKDDMCEKIEKFLNDGLKMESIT